MKPLFENPHDERNTKRCRKCGEVKSVTEFAWRKNANAYIARCYDCINEEHRARYRPRIKGGPPPWTDEEKAKLRECICCGMSPAETAAAVGRSEPAVHRQRHRQDMPYFGKRLRGPAGHRPKWPSERVENLKQLRARNVPVRECAAVLGITVGAVVGATARYLREDA